MGMRKKEGLWVMVTPLSTRCPPLLKPCNSAVMVPVKILPVLTEPQPRMKCGGEGDGASRIERRGKGNQL